MKKFLSKLSIFLFLLTCIFVINNSNVYAKSYAFSGTYTGKNISNEKPTKITLSSDKTITVYINNKLFTKQKVKKTNENTYKVPGSYICLKLYGDKIKIYASNGRNAKIPYSGTFKKSITKTYKFSGKYKGVNSQRDKFQIILYTNKKMKVYINGSLYAYEKVTKISNNTYKIPNSYVCIKLYGDKIKIYASNGRDAKIPYSGTFKK